MSKKLLEELNAVERNIMVGILEKNDLLGDIQPIPPEIRLEPGGKAVVMNEQKAKVTDIYNVMEVLQDIVNFSIDSSKPSWLNDNKLTIQRPNEYVESENPSIVYKVLDGKPGAAGVGPVNQPIRRMVTPILIGKYNDPKDDTSEVYIYGQRFDYNINLSIYGKTAHEADILKEWLMDIIKTYLWYVRYSGVLDFVFVQDNGDELESGRHKRTIQYAISIEKITWSSFFLLKEFILKLSTS